MTMSIPTRFTRLPNLLLEAGDPLKIDIYVHLPRNDKAVLRYRTGTVLNLDEFSELKAMGPSQVLVQVEELERVMAALMNTPEEAEEVAVEVMQKMAEGPPAMTRQLIQESNLLVQKVLDDIVAQRKASGGSDLSSLLAKLEKGDGDLHQHSRNVSAVAVLLLLSLGGATAEDAGELALAGILHDLFLEQVPEFYRVKHLTGEDFNTSAADSISRSHLKAHIDGVTHILNQPTMAITPTIRKIIQQHHEHYDGSGLGGFSQSQIHYSARVLKIADDLISLLHGQELTLGQALQELQNYEDRFQMRVYDPELIAKIKKTVFA